MSEHLGDPPEPIRSPPDAKGYIFMMEVYESNLHLFAETPTDSFVEKTEWIPYVPQGMIGTLL